MQITVAQIYTRDRDTGARTLAGRGLVEVTARRAPPSCVGVLKVAHVAEEALVQIALVIGLDYRLGPPETRMRQDFARFAARR